MALESVTTTTRRGLLAAATSAVVGLVASSIGRGSAVRGANNDAVHVGKSYDGTAPTKIKNTSTATGEYAIVGRASSATGAGIYGQNTADGGDGVLGSSDTGAGLHGTSTDGIAIHAESDHGAGILAVVKGLAGAVLAANLGTGAAIQASALAGSAITAGSDSKPAITADSTHSTGIVGTTSGASDPGVRAGVVGAGGSHTGGYFTSDSGTALKVDGKAVFSRGGRFTIAAGTTAKLIPVDGVTTSSYVLVMLQTHAEGISITAAVPGDGEFTVYVNKPHDHALAIGYLALD